MSTSTATPRTPPGDLGVERVDWSILGPEFFTAWGRPNGRYDPEPVTVYGKSGSGKSFFIGYIVAERARLRGSHVVYVATKPTDRTISGMGWPIVTDWPPGYNEHQVIFWAKAKGISAAARVPQQRKIKELMNKLWVKDSNIIVVWDELVYLEIMLKLKPEIETFYREGRAMGITNVAGMQRPAGVTRLAHSEAGWTVAFPPKDVDDRDRVAEVFGDRRRFAAVMDSLDRTKHEFLIRHDLTGEAYISHLPRRRPAPPARATGVSGRLGYGVRSRQR